MSATMIEVSKDLLSDYDDGYTTVLRLASRMSAGGLIGYADTAGPELDSLSVEDPFFEGMRDALAEQVSAAIDRVPSEVSQWLNITATDRIKHGY